MDNTQWMLNTLEINYQAHAHMTKRLTVDTCWCPPQNDITNDVSSNLSGVWISPGILAQSRCSQAELSNTQITEKSLRSLWKVFLACLLACVITTAMGVLILSLVNNKGNNSTVVIQLPTSSGGSPTASITSQSTVTTTSAQPTTATTSAGSTTTAFSTGIMTATPSTVTSTQPVSTTAADSTTGSATAAKSTAAVATTASTITSSQPWTTTAATPLESSRYICHRIYNYHHIQWNNSFNSLTCYRNGRHNFEWSHSCHHCHWICSCSIWLSMHILIHYSHHSNWRCNLYPSSWFTAITAILSLEVKP